MIIKSKSADYNAFIGLRLSQNLNKELSIIAERKNLNLSELIREILTAYVKKYNNPY